MKIIVIGTSAGGIEALKSLCEELPKDLPAAVFIVWHLSPLSRNHFPEMLAKKSNMPVQSAVNGQSISEGHIYTAPPDHHLILEDKKIRVVYGPKENRFRPAIDPLFRSAAYSFGKDTIGILLSGMLSDGTAGLWSIMDRGGITIVQDPEEAQFPDMPLNALHNIDVDYKITLKEMAPLLKKLTSTQNKKNSPDHKPESMGIEVSMAADNYIEDTDIKKIGELSEFTCPECHGSLWRINEGNIIRFRCRTGHAFSVPALLEELSVMIEDLIWAAVRGLEENSSLINYLTEHLHSAEDKEQMKIYHSSADQALKYANILRNLLLENIKGTVEPA